MLLCYAASGNFKYIYCTCFPASNEEEKTIIWRDYMFQYLYHVFNNACRQNGYKLSFYGGMQFTLPEFRGRKINVNVIHNWIDNKKPEVNLTMMVTKTVLIINISSQSTEFVSGYIWNVQNHLGKTFWKRSGSCWCHPIPWPHIGVGRKESFPAFQEGRWIVHILLNKTLMYVEH